VTYPDFKVTIIQRQTTQKRYNIQRCDIYNDGPIESSIIMVYRTAPFLMTFNDHYPGFTVTSVLTLII